MAHHAMSQLNFTQDTGKQPSAKSPTYPITFNGPTDSYLCTLYIPLVPMVQICPTIASYTY